MKKIKIFAAFIVFALLLSITPALLAASAADIVLPGSSELQKQIYDFSSNAWQSDGNRDMGYTTLKGSGTQSRTLVSTKAFEGAFTLRFTLNIKNAPYDGNNVKSLFYLSLSGDAAGGYRDFFLLWEPFLNVGGEMSMEPANGYPALLWQQDGINGEFNAAVKYYDFMFDVKENGTADVYIEKYGTPLTKIRYTAVANPGVVFGGHLVFESGTTNYDYEIGSLAVEYYEDGVNRIFYSNFNQDGAVATAPNKTGKTAFITNITAGNSTRKEDTQRIEPNQYLYGNFEITSTVFTVEYELSGIVNANHFSDTSPAAAAICFVGGITDMNPDGVILGRAMKNFFGYGAADANKSIYTDAFPAPVFIDGIPKLKIKIEFRSATSYQMYAAAFLNGSSGYTEYVTFDDPGDTGASFSGDIGRIGVRAYSPGGASPVSFRVQLLSFSAGTAVSDGIYLGKPPAPLLNLSTPEHGGSLYVLLPEIAVFNPADAGDYAVWALAPSDIAALNGDIMTVTGVGQLQLTLSVHSNPSVSANYTADVLDGTLPVIALREKYILTESGILTENDFWRGISVTDNVTENIVPVLESIVYYADIEDNASHLNGVPKAFAAGSLPLEAGIYEFTVSAADLAGKCAEEVIKYFVDVVTITGAQELDFIVFAGAAVIVDLPSVQGLGGGFVFEVVKGSAAVGMGANAGKLLIFDGGEVELLLFNALLPELKKSFVFTVADNSAPVIAAYFMPSVRIGTPEAEIILANCFEISHKSGAVNVIYGVKYFASKQDMDAGANAAAVSAEGGKFTAGSAGWYQISVTADDGKGNSAAKTFAFEAIDEKPENKKDGAPMPLFYKLSIAAGALIFLEAGLFAFIILKRKKV